MSSDQAYYTRRYVRYAEKNALAAICVRRNGVDSMYYVHPDRLGSYTHITDSSRRVVRSLHFDPWGNVKNDANWLVFDSTTLFGNLAGTFRFSRGFTGHEHYADLKIINMKAPSKREQKQACLIFVEREVLRDEVSTYGRLYDPVIARFFSPDNFVQVPEFTQSYNRYSYCLNNPLQWVDPSGESFISDFLYGICNFLTLPARAITESVSWLNDHINGNVKADGYFHSDYLFNSAPPHYIDYQNVINLQNPYVYSFYEPDMMADADGTTYRTEYYWTAVGAGGTYNLTFANQTFSGTFGPYKEYIQWHTREVPVEKDVESLSNHSNLNPDLIILKSTVGNGATIASYEISNEKIANKFKYGSYILSGVQLYEISADIYENRTVSAENIYDLTSVGLGLLGPIGATASFTLDMYKQGVHWFIDYYKALDNELRRMNSPQYYY